MTPRIAVNVPFEQGRTIKPLKEKKEENGEKSTKKNPRFYERRHQLPATSKKTPIQ